MTKRFCVAALALSGAILPVAGCTIVPGLDLSIDHKYVGAPSEIGGFELVEVTPSVIFDLAERVGINRYQSGLDELLDTSNENHNEYLVGPGDVLTIIVWDHPELTSPTGEFRDPESSGRLVGADGKIFYPYIGELKVAGLPVSSIRRLISAQLARVVKDPQVDVRVAAFRSQRVKVTGEVVSPAIVPITDRGLTIVEAIASTGGLADTASRYLAVLSRGGSEYQIDIRSKTQAGDSYGEVVLRHGDILHVPNSDEYSAYILGAVDTQAAIPLPRGSMSLAEAISKVNGLDSGVADRSRLYIVRAESVDAGEGVDGEEDISVYVLDMSHVASLVLSERFELLPRDVVYVDRTGLATYNSVVSQVLPTVSTLFQLDRLVND